MGAPTWYLPPPEKKNPSLFFGRGSKRGFVGMGVGDGGWVVLAWPGHRRKATEGKSSKCVGDLFPTMPHWLGPCPPCLDASSGNTNTTSGKNLSRVTTSLGMKLCGGSEDEMGCARSWTRAGATTSKFTIGWRKRFVRADKA